MALQSPNTSRFVLAKVAVRLLHGVYVPDHCPGCPGLAGVPLIPLHRWHISSSLACGLISSYQVETLTKQPWPGPGDPSSAYLEAPASKAIIRTSGPAEGEPVGKLSTAGSEWSDGSYEGDGPEEGCAILSHTIELDPPEPAWSAGTAGYDWEITTDDETANYTAPGLPAPAWRGDFLEGEPPVANDLLSVTTVDGDDYGYARSFIAVEWKYRIDLTDKVDDWPPGLALRGALVWSQVTQYHTAAPFYGPIQSESITLTASNPVWESAAYESVAPAADSSLPHNYTWAEVFYDFLPQLPW